MTGDFALGVLAGFAAFGVLQGLAVGLLAAWGCLLERARPGDGREGR